MEVCSFITWAVERELWPSTRSPASQNKNCWHAAHMPGNSQRDKSQHKLGSSTDFPQILQSFHTVEAVREQRPCFWREKTHGSRKGRVKITGSQMQVPALQTLWTVSRICSSEIRIRQWLWLSVLWRRSSSHVLTYALWTILKEAVSTYTFRDSS